MQSYSPLGVAMQQPDSTPLWPAALVPREASLTRPELPDTPQLYADHAALVWRALVHLGVPAADREDLLQEVFMIVHRARSEYEGRGQLTSWLYGIALRVASRHRRREQVRSGNARESNAHHSGDQVELRTPEHVAALRQRAELLQRILARLPAKKRDVFVMFEIEGMSCDQIARALAVAPGTVFSRLHSAREAFFSIWQEFEAAPEKGRGE